MSVSPVARSRYKSLALALAASAVAVAASMASIEAWVRLRWDDRRGTPGFYLSDPILGQRLAPGYHGWFAGVPVHINAFGFRDPRDYAAQKAPGTFRILVFGDSVTFGHGAAFESTYPFLLESRLKAWRPDVSWEIWNLGVPGYNTSQELAYLEEVGPLYDPDLVIVGFYENDFADNRIVTTPSALRRFSSALQRTLQQSLYSYEFYRRVALTLRFRLLTRAEDRQRLEQLEGEGKLLARESGQAESQDQATLDYFDDEEVRNLDCAGKSRAEDNDRLFDRLRSPSEEIASWRTVVRRLQQLNREGVYRIMFFINMAPRPCPAVDRFYDGGSLEDDEALSEVLGDGTPVASSTREFLHYRPSQMPGAGGHSTGHANRVKADALFETLRTNVLPTLLKSH